MSKKIAVIIGTTRPSRVGADIADWFVRSVSDTPNTSFEIIDLREVNLPFLDEIHTPNNGPYEKAHTVAWKEQVEQYEGFVFVTAEYNAGYPAPLKNAIDYLGPEWRSKPAAIVSYGWSGGASASAQLRQVLDRLKMRVAGVAPSLKFDGDTFTEDAKLADADKSFASNVEEAKMAVQQLGELLAAE